MFSFGLLDDGLISVHDDFFEFVEDVSDDHGAFLLPLEQSCFTWVLVVVVGVVYTLSLDFGLVFVGGSRILMVVVVTLIILTWQITIAKLIIGIVKSSLSILGMTLLKSEPTIL